MQPYRGGYRTSEDQNTLGNFCCPEQFGTIVRSPTQGWSTDRKTRIMFSAIYRPSALRITSGYQAISDEVICISTGVLPTDICAPDLPRKDVACLCSAKAVLDCFRNSDHVACVLERKYKRKMDTPIYSKHERVDQSSTWRLQLEISVETTTRHSARIF